MMPSNDPAMSDEQKDNLPATAADSEPAEAVISAQNALRLLLALLAIWSFFSGLALIFFQANADATIGGGLDGGEGTAAQRLLGVHILVLTPIYVLLAMDPTRYRLLLWVPYAAQGGVVAVTLFDIATGKRDFLDGALPLIVASIFLVLLVYVWRAGTQATKPLPPEDPEPAAPEDPEAGDSA